MSKPGTEQDRAAGPTGDALGAAADGAARKVARGDFQTPLALAREVCALLAREGVAPVSLIEPTCGTGAFLIAALESFSTLRHVVAADIDSSYIAQARSAVGRARSAAAATMTSDQRHVAVACEWHVEDFFTAPWPERIAGLPGPLLLLGNPPWVTTARLATVGGANGPVRTNIDRVRGIAALTGRGHFDVSEALVRAALRWAGQRRAVVALLCKSAVARKALAAAWRDDIRGIDGARCALRSIDARRWFGASVDAALLVVRADGGGATQGRARSCAVYAALDVTSPTRSFGWADGELLADVERGPEDAALRSSRPTGWRSGIKHDAAALFELVGDGRRFVNGLGDRIELESELVWPLLKATDLARGRSPTRWLLVPQQSMSEDPAVRLAASPLARAYLERHADRLQRRKSRIYRGRPIGSLFGVGDYSFAPWKVAVSALHAQPRFRVVGPHAGRPVVVEDTCCILACRDEAQASARAAWLDSRPAQEFLAARTFADRKRPITVELLDRLAIHEIGAALDGGTGIRAPDPPRATGP